MSPSRRRTVQILASFLLAAGFLLLAFRNQDLGRIWTEITRIRIGWVLLFVPVSFASHVVRAWRWKYFLTPVKPVLRLRHLLASVMIGYFFNSLLPRFGELARPYAINKLERIPLSTAIGTVIVERVIDVISLVAIFALSLAFFREPIRRAFPWMESGSAVLLAGSIAFLVFTLFLTLKSEQTIAFVDRFLHLVPARFASRVEGVLRTFIDGLLVIHNREKYLMIGLLTALLWFLYTLQFYVVFFAFASTASLDLLAAMVVMVISSVGILIPMPGGTGTFHLFCSQGLSLLFGIPTAQALSYATVTHAIGLIFLLIFGSFFLVTSDFRFSVTKTAGEAKSPIGGNPSEPVT